MKSYAYTHPGHVRKINEDAYYVDDLKGLWIVCDGMGGHDEGSFASHLVTDSFASLTLEKDFEFNIELIVDLIHIIVKNLQLKHKMLGSTTLIGTTLILLYIKDDQAVTIQCGDSRCYHLRKNDFSLLSLDHAVDMNTENGSRKVLTNALYTPGDIELEMKKYTIEKNDVFFLCTDGMYDNLTEDNIKQGMQQESLSLGLQDLYESVLRTDANDNLTGVLVSIS